MTEASLGIFEVTSGPELVDSLAPHNAPVSSVVWADRHGSIGFKCIGRVPRRRGATPRPAAARLERASTSGRAGSPTRRCPRSSTPRSATSARRTTGSRPRDTRHHIGSDWFDGYRARRIEDVLAAGEAHDLDSFAELQTDMLSLPGIETAHRLARLRPRDQRERRAIEHLRSWDGRMAPDSVAATIYQQFTLRFARELARAVIGDRDLAARWLDRAENGFMAHVSSPWRWQSHVLALWEEADPELIGRDWDDFALDALRASIDDLVDRFGDDSAAWRWGDVHALEFPHALGAASPLLARLLQPHAAGRRRPGDRLPGRLGPERPVLGDLGARMADGRRPARSRPLALAGVRRASPGTSRASTTTTSSRAGSPARRSRWPARARGRRSSLRPRAGGR